MNVWRYSCGVSFAALMMVLPALAKAAPVSFDLPVQSLATSVKAVASAEGLTLVVNDDLLAGKTAPALKGDFEAEDALRSVLAGSGLTVTINGRVAEIIAQSSDIQLERVKVADSRLTLGQNLQHEGTAEQGYRATTATTTGPWGDMPIQDMPYSVSVMSSDLIENIQAEDASQLYRMNPLTQSAWNVTQYDSNINSVTIRGFSSNANVLFDGLNLISASDNSLEDKERVEILPGLSSFLYGANSNVGGVVDWILKRPTDAPLHEVTAGDYGGARYYTHADLSDAIDDAGKVKYRLNLVDSDGDTSIKDQSLERYLVSGALDWNVTDNLLMQANGSHQYYDIHGPSAVWATMAAGAQLPAAPKADQPYSQPWGFIKTVTDNYGLKGTWNINDTFTLRSEWQHQQDERTSIYNMNENLTSNGTYSQYHDGYAPSDLIDDGVYAYLDSKFATGFIGHTLTTGMSDSFYTNRQYKNSMPGFGTSTGLSFSNPFAPEPSNFSTAGIGPMYTSSETTYKNYLIGDNVVFNDQWSLLIGVNYADVYQGSFNTNGVKTSDYEKSAITPSTSLLFKPLQWITTYVTYMEGLQPGTIVGAGYTNAGQALAPLVSRQYETGVKATVGGLLLTGALYQIDKANQYSNNATPIPTYVQDGLQVNKGLEMTATGKLNDEFTVLGGLTFLDPTVEKTNTPAYNGKRATGTSDTMAKMYIEYNVPFVRGFTLTSGVYYNGMQYADSLNTVKVPSYVVADLGARYAFDVDDRTIILRLNVTNVTDENYWQTSQSLGSPRTVLFSTSAKF